MDLPERFIGVIRHGVGYNAAAVEDEKWEVVVFDLLQIAVIKTATGLTGVEQVYSPDDDLETMGLFDTQKEAEDQASKLSADYYLPWATLTTTERLLNAAESKSIFGTEDRLKISQLIVLKGDQDEDI
jgi:hypothetical protein